MPELSSLQRTLGKLRQLVGDVPTDACLLERFARRRDEAAFAEVVKRHGPLVLGVSRRVLGNIQAAEDVFQATFLTLARRAGSIAWQASVGPWLHATASRLARKARAAAKRRPAPEPLDTAKLPASAGDAAASLMWEEVRQTLDEELLRLPERLRAPLVLCYLQGRTRDEAARTLGCSLAMLKRRLERGRHLLGDRLTRRGLALSAAGWGLALHEPPVSAAIAETTARAAVAFVIHGLAAPGVTALLSGGPLLTPLRGAWIALVLALGAGVLALPRGERQATVPMPEKAAASAPHAKTEDDPLPAGALARLGSVRWRPGARTTHLAFSPDGKQLASLGNFLYHHDRLSIWDTATGRELNTGLIEENLATALNWRPDGRGFLVLKQYDDQEHRVRDFRVWEFTDEHVPPPPPPRNGLRTWTKKVAVGGPKSRPPETFGRCAISPDGKLLAADHSGGSLSGSVIELWELKAANSVKELKHVRSLRPMPDSCTGLTFGSDGRTLLVFNYQNGNKLEEQLTIWDVAKGEARRNFMVPYALQQGERKTLAVFTDGRALAVGLENGTTRLFDLESGRERLSVGKHETPGKGAPWSGVSSVNFTRDSKSLITAGRDNAVKVWDAASGRLRFDLRGHHSWPEALAVSPVGSILATSGQDGLILLWDVATGKALCPPQGHAHIVWGVAISPDGRTVATAALDRTLRLWNLDSGRQKQVIPGPLHSPRFAPDGREVLAPDGDRLRRWDAATGAEMPLPDELTKEGGYAFGFSPDGRTLLTAKGRVAALWDWPAGRVRRQWTAAKDVTSACLAPDGRTLLTTSTGHYNQGAPFAVEVWDAVTGRPRGRLALEPGSNPTLTVITPDSRTALIVGRAADYGAPASGRAPERVHAWSLDMLNHLRTFESSNAGGARPYTLSIALSPDGRTLATAESDGSATLFEVATGRVRRRLVGHREGVTSLAFTPDGKRLVTGSADHSCLVWNVSLSALAPSKGTRELSAGEREKLWIELASEKAPAAYQAQARLASVPEAAVALCKAKLRPATGPDDAALDRLLRDLDSEQFEVREKASAELDRLGESAAAGVRERFSAAKSLELRLRLKRFLEAQDLDKPTPERLRHCRAVEVLEYLGTDTARALLRELAKGSPAAPQTQEVRAALARLERRGP